MKMAVKINRNKKTDEDYAAEKKARLEAEELEEKLMEEENPQQWYNPTSTARVFRRPN